MGANMSRNKDLAGQSVKQGNYTVTYDKNGYATKAVKDGGSSATSTKKTTKANNSAAHQEAYQAAQRGDWDAVGNAVNKLSVNGDMKDANAYMQELQDEFKYNANDYYKGKYESVYGEGSWDGGSNGVQNTIDKTDQLISSVTGGSSPTVTVPDFSQLLANYQMPNAAAPEYGGSQWDSVLDSLAQQLLAMTYEGWTQSDQYGALANRYGTAGQKSMQDVLGQMAARTGGLASSYANTVANQEYNNYMSQLEAVAREMYGAERDDLTANAQLAQNFANNDYNKFQDELAQWNNDRNYAYNAFRDSVADQKYKTEFEYQQARDQFEDQLYQQELAYKQSLQAQADAEERAKTMAAVGDFSGFANLGYTADQIALLQAAYDMENGTYTGSVTGGGPVGRGGIDNGGLTDAQIRELQEYIGAGVDGLWGSNSSDKAGGLSAGDAWSAYQSNTLVPSGLPSGAYGPFLTGNEQAGGSEGGGYDDLLTDIQALRKAGESSATINNVIVAAQKAGMITAEEAIRLRNSYVGGR